VLKADTSDMLRSTNKEVKRLLFNINKVVSNGENSHLLLHDNQSVEVEVLDALAVNLKLRLRDKTPPLTLLITYKSRKDLLIYSSRTCKEPSEDNN
jgi:hypothetical protein